MHVCMYLLAYAFKTIYIMVCIARKTLILDLRANDTTRPYLT